MLTFLFWNLKSENLERLCSLVEQHNADMLILAECPLATGHVLTALNRKTNDFYMAQCDCAKLQLFTKFSDEYVLPVTKNGEAFRASDFTFRRFVLPTRLDFLLCAVHFPSKLYSDPIDQTAFTLDFTEVLGDVEETLGHARTVLVGDLNMNPYEDGMVMNVGLHAVATRKIALQEARRVKFQSNMYFYNPMWSHFGEKKQGHAGTYYFATPKARADFWNIYDQVLVRPSLLPYFKDEDVSILHEDLAAKVSLLQDDGKPNAKEISDHLPLLFRLNI